MSALQFLNKKSWHTSTIRNNEKVWLKEQAAAKEQQRILELEKQLAEERKLAEIQRLELESGRLDPAEALKRRRLNWMYEHGPANTPQEKEKEEEKNKQDILLGKKKMEVEEVGKERETKLALVDVEAKLREDPMFEVEIQRARASKRVLGRETIGAKYTREEINAKRARKEDRRRQREDRRVRREERHLRKRQRALERERSLQKKTHSEQALREEEKDGITYGLMIPAGGSGVEVKAEFIPRPREGKATGKKRGESSREEAGLTSSSSEGARSDLGAQGRPPLSPKLRRKASETRKLLQEMKDEALKLETERRKRAERHVKDANREMELMDNRGRRRKSSLRVGEEEPAVEFARQTIAKGSSAADRIRQRRGWATTDASACY